MKLFNTLALSVTKILVFGAIVVSGGVYFMKFADGPWGMVPGGEFSQAVQTPPDSWAFVKDRDTVEFQLRGPGTSRTSWIAEHNNRIFIPSAYMNSTFGKLWKHWPIHAEGNGAALLRIDDRVYTVHLTRIKDTQVLEPVLTELARKYMTSKPPMDAMLAQVTNNDLWVFELLNEPQQEL